MADPQPTPTPTPTPAPTPNLMPWAKTILGYALAIALAYIAAKWGIVPAPTPPQPVANAPGASP